MPQNNRAYLLINKKHHHRVLTSAETGGGFEYKLLKHKWAVGAHQVVLPLSHRGNWLLEIGDNEYLTFTGGKLTQKPDMHVLGGSHPTSDKDHWRVGSKDHNGYRHVTNVSTGDYLVYSSHSDEVKLSSDDHGDGGRWKFLLLPDPFDLEDDSKSATDWKDVARYVFQEGLKMVKAANEPRWFEMGDAVRESYVDLFKDMGRKKDVYP